ncbi:MAG: hypothetical protein PHY93_10975 [Bacteriovorax sp.]|nr:hypothetical protein [Bacteriovorax sp.]
MIKLPLGKNADSLLLFKAPLAIFAKVLLISILAIGAFITFKGDKPNLYYVIDCNIYNSNLTLMRSSEGSHCEFFSDGSTLSGMPEKLTYYDQNLQIVWQKNISVHHAFTKSLDEKKVYVLTSSYHQFLGEKTRFDNIEILDIKTGNSLSSWSSYIEQNLLISLEPRAYIKENHRLPLRSPEEIKNQVYFEFLHFNSIYEIPENSLSDDLDFLKPHGLVVNTGPGLVLFFDDKLNYLSSVHLGKTSTQFAHDVQVGKNGDLLFFTNHSAGYLHSSLHKMDLRNNKIIWTFKSNAQLKNFFNWRFGSVQELDDSFLFSDLTTKGTIVEIAKDGSLIKSFDNPVLNPYTQKPIDMLTLKKLDLNSYLTNFHGY